MNRRSFLKLGLLGIAAIFLPNINIGEPMNKLEDLWAKMANQARLTPEELQDLKIHGKSTEQRNAFVAGNTTPQGTLNVQTAFFSLYSKILEKNETSVRVEIPGNYRHLLIYGAGRIDSKAGSDAVYLDMIFNDDAGTNYARSTLVQSGATVAGSAVTGESARIGHLTADGSPADYAGSFECSIPHYGSSFYKQSIARGGPFYDTGYPQTLHKSSWSSTAKITSITLFPEASFAGAEIVLGTSISIYGIL